MQYYIVFLHYHCSRFCQAQPKCKPQPQLRAELVLVSIPPMAQEIKLTKKAILHQVYTSFDQMDLTVNSINRPNQSDLI